MTDRGRESSSIRKDVEGLCDIIAGLDVRSLADAGTDVCEMFLFAIADASEYRSALIAELDFREATILENEMRIYAVTNPKVMSGGAPSRSHEKPKLFIVRD